MSNDAQVWAILAACGLAIAVWPEAAVRSYRRNALLDAPVEARQMRIAGIIWAAVALGVMWLKW